jgi:TRAP-type C4-dicarboxylate transport system permease small subunit
MNEVSASQSANPGAFARGVGVLARLCAYLGGVVLVAIALMSAYSIAARAITGKPIQGDFELVQIGCAICIAMFLPICQLTGGNIIVDFFTAKAKPATRGWLDAFGALLVCVMMVLLVWRTGLGTMGVKANAETSMIMGVPIWWGYVGMLPGLAVTVLASLVTIGEKVAEARA